MSQPPAVEDVADLSDLSRESKPDDVGLEVAGELDEHVPLDELLRALTAAGVPRFADASRAKR